MKDTSVTVNNVSYNGEHAKTLGREEWVKEVAQSNFEGDETKAGEAHDAILKELGAREEQEKKDEADAKNREDSRQKAQTKLEERQARGDTRNSKVASKPEPGAIDSSTPRNAGAVTTKSISG